MSIKNDNITSRLVKNELISTDIVDDVMNYLDDNFDWSDMVADMIVVKLLENSNTNENG